MFHQVQSSIRDFNLFQSEPPSTDPVIVHDQRLSTRIFLMILILSIIVVSIYFSTLSVMYTVRVDAPTYSQYLLLHATQPETVSCPCSQLSMNYGQFYTVNYSQHQICDSVFVDDEWITSIRMNMSERGLASITDFRGHGFKLFQALRNFCKTTSRIISNGLNRSMPISTSPLQ